eukprot:8482-Heterococcus_DN1.PRE.2
MAASTYWQPVVFGFIVAVIKLSVLHTFQTCKCIVVVVCYSHIAQAADLSSNTFKSYTSYIFMISILYAADLSPKCHMLLESFILRCRAVKQQQQRCAAHKSLQRLDVSPSGKNPPLSVLPSKTMAFTSATVLAYAMQFSSHGTIVLIYGIEVTFHRPASLPPPTLARRSLIACATSATVAVMYGGSLKSVAQSR